MNWRFFKKQEDPLAEELHHLKLQLTSMADKIVDVDQQLQKLTRLQYKTGKSLEEELKSVTDHFQNQTEKNASPSSERVIASLMQQLDDMDMIYAGLSIESQWRNPLTKWTTSTLNTLSDLGIDEYVYQGKIFDSRFTEAVKTVPLQEGFQPHEIIEVYKRGFVDSSGNVIRKGQVITVKEEV